MYCNKCGKEIADGVSFCTSCGEKVVASSNTVVHKEIVMVCSKCGKMAENSMKFCTHCGGPIVQIERYSESNGNSTTKPDMPTISLSGVTNRFFGLISVVLISILALIYIVTAVQGFEGNMDAFDWLSDGYKTLGIVLHWGVCAIFVLDCLQCIFNVLKAGIKGKHIISSSITLLITTFMLWIGKIIWNDFEFEDVSILLYRLFGTYGKITAVSFVLLIIALIFGILCSKTEQD